MNILITGATKGIGRSIAEASSKKGLSVFATGRNENLLKDYDNYCICDLATNLGMEKLGKYIKANEIDILINNAGEYLYTPAQDGFDLESIEHITKLKTVCLFLFPSYRIMQMDAVTS